MADRDNTATFVDLILAIFLPPLGVFFKYGCQVTLLMLALIMHYDTLPLMI
jgi:uncharacterized membrane protein YqaE (UPF0057 family)